MALGGVRIVAPEGIPALAFDRVVIASIQAPSIRRQLRDLGVDAACIEEAEALTETGSPEFPWDGLLFLALIAAAVTLWWVMP
jgi:hypothetical protein